MFLPKYYEFCCRVKTIAGHKALESIAGELDTLGARNPIIITDKGVSGAGLIKIVRTALGKKVKIAAIEDNVPPDSDVSVVNRVAKLYKSKKCDSIIAVGGGSVMDTAKAVNILVSLGGDDLMSYTGAGKVTEKLNPLVVIPTTSGTGSEMTLVAVIADHARKMKMAFTSYFLLPDLAVLDSRMTKTLPPFLTSSTAMDALTHACEAYTCMGKNPLSDAYAIPAIQLISQNVVRAVKKPGDMKARLALANGSALAGVAFSNSMVAIVHNIGHAIGGVCNVPHGVAMGILLPYGLEYNYHKSAHYTADLLYPLAGEEEFINTPLNKRPEKAVAYIRQLNEDLHAATGGRHSRYLKEVVDRDGNQMVPREKFDDIIRTAKGDPAQFYNPEDVDENDYRVMLECAYEGIPLDRKKIKKGKRTSKIRIP
ncbi:MAG TPA: iron-containing alcohol dehydrogenase [Spirochaetota bacterium]|nr:iron-containing alcohol dehydrogenase [Spirochaetota bacterium]HPJ37182.1 iron-containing alcohol dehydrogenase [Spirochaetota bacterium]HPQ52538.1 iron-containing alcohol dehydrogenase [Spirochaetota bacterium]